MYSVPWITSSRLGRKEKYQPVSPVSDSEPATEFSYGENQRVLKICRQLRLLFVAGITVIVLVFLNTLNSALRPAASSAAVAVPQSFNSGDVLLAPECLSIHAYFVEEPSSDK